MTAAGWAEELTDEDLERIAAARAAAAAPPSELGCRLTALLALERRPRTVREPVVRMCTRCGIDTTRPELCRDCEDVGW